MWEYLSHSGEVDDKAIDERLIIRLTVTAINKVLPTTLMDEKIVLIPVSHGRGELPQDFRFVVQAAFKEGRYLKSYGDEVKKCADALVGSDYVVKPYCRVCNSVQCSCGSSPVVIIPTSTEWKKNNAALGYVFDKHYYNHFNIVEKGRCSAYHPDFVLMRRKSGNFYNYNQHIKECINLRVPSLIEYDLDNPNIVVNRPTGTILLSYMGIKMDDEGYPMVPDDEWILDYIRFYIDERLAYQDCRRTRRQEDCGFYELAKANADSAFKKVKSKAIPSYDKLNQYLKSRYNKLINFTETDKFNSAGFFVPDSYYEPGETSGDLNNYTLDLRK